MSNLAYFGLGILLGLGISIYYMVSREEKIEKRMLLSRQIYTTKKLNQTMESVIEKISGDVERLKRELTEEEKNEIIMQCYNQKFMLNKF